MILKYIFPLCGSLIDHDLYILELSIFFFKKATTIIVCPVIIKHHYTTIGVTFTAISNHCNSIKVKNKVYFTHEGLNM